MRRTVLIRVGVSVVQRRQPWSPSHRLLQCREVLTASRHHLDESCRSSARCTLESIVPRLRCVLDDGRLRHLRTDLSGFILRSDR